MENSVHLSTLIFHLIAVHTFENPSNGLHMSPQFSSVRIWDILNSAEVGLIPVAEVRVVGGNIRNDYTACAHVPMCPWAA